MSFRVPGWLPVLLIAGFIATPASAQDEKPVNDEKPVEDETTELKEQLEAVQKRLNDLEARVDKQQEDMGTGNIDLNTIRVTWKDTLQFETLNKKINIKLGGRVHADAFFLSGDRRLENQVGDLEDGAIIRRTRISISGTLYKHVGFKTQYEFAGGDATFTDIFIDLRKLPFIGILRFGQQKEPFGLEITESSNDFPFIARATLQTLQIIRNTGIRVLNHYEERLTWSVGVYRDSDNFGNTFGEGEYHITGRVTGVPYRTENGRRLVHVGASYSRRSPDDNIERYRSRPQVEVGPRLLDTGNFAAKAIDVYGAEAAFVLGSFSMQAEAMYNNVDAPGGIRQHFWAYYVYATYFLTGENRHYKGSEGFFNKVKVKKPFLQDGGYGAFEVGLRYSFLDLDTRQQKAGKLSALTFMLNWYPITHTRLMINVIRANLESVDQADALVFRFQLVF